jgi:predicted nuclease of predicted toxin-antitoxin system
MRFLANMGISGRTVNWLHQNGHDAVHLRNQGLQRLPDAEIAAKARLEGRIILTTDLGFGRLLAHSGEASPSVISFRLSDERADNVNLRLSAVLAQFQHDLEAGAIISVRDSLIRLRRLPIEP